MPVPDLVVDLLRTLDNLAIPYAVGGSFASSVWGIPRQTNNIDIVIQSNFEQAKGLIETLERDYLVSMADVETAFSSDETFPAFQLIDIEQVFKVDIFVLPPGDYTEELLKRRRRLLIPADYKAFFVSQEDIVIAKLRWFVLGNRVSDRQWNDIVQVLESRASAFDFDYAARWAKHFNVFSEFVKAKQKALG